MHISRTDVPIGPLRCQLSQCEWVSNPTSAVTHRETRVRLSAHRELQRVQCNCLSEGVVINNTPSPHQPKRICALPPFGKCEWGPDTTSEMCRMALSRFASLETNRCVRWANVQRASEGRWSNGSLNLVCSSASGEQGM